MVKRTIRRAGWKVAIAAGMACILVPQSTAIAAQPPQGGHSSAPAYMWSELHRNPQLTGMSPDPGLSTSNASQLGIRWMTNTGTTSLGSPVVAWNAKLQKSLILVPNDAGQLIAYDQATGLPLWSDSFGQAIESTPLIDGDYVWVGVTTGSRLYKLSATTGATICSAPIDNINGDIQSDPTMAVLPNGKTTVFDGADDTAASNGPVTAVDESTCTVDWSVNHEPKAASGGEWDPISYGVDRTGEPLVFYGTSDPDSAVYAVDAETGALVWRYAVYNPKGGADVGAGVTVSLPGVNGFADGVVYAPSKYGIMYALDMTTGSLIWQYNFGANSGASPPGTLSTPALAGTDLDFGDGAGVYQLNSVTGTLKWHFVTNSETDSSPAIVGISGKRVVAFASLNGGLYVLSNTSGSLLYHYQTGGFVSASIADENGNLIVSSGDGYIYDLAVGGGNDSPPTTVVSSPANGSTVPNPIGQLTISGTASSSSAIGAVSVSVREGAAGGPWWDSATQSWSVAPYPNPATLSSPGTTNTQWSVAVPVDPSGAVLEVFASAVNASGVADRSAPGSAPTPARSTFTVRPASTVPSLTRSLAYVAPGQAFIVSGSHFAATEQVDIVVGHSTIGKGTTTSDGTLPPTPVTMSPVAFGPESLVATGRTAGDKTTASVYVTNAWSQYRQNATRLGTDPDDVVFRSHPSLSQSTYLAQAWSFSASAAVSGSVAAVDGVAYAADANGMVYAIDIGSGRDIWSHNDGGSAIDDTPALVGGLVIVGTAAGELLALSQATGDLAWSASIGSGAIQSSVAVVGTTLYVGSDDGRVYAIDGETGSQIWASAALSGAVVSSPAVDTVAGLIVVGDQGGGIDALHLADGSAAWSVKSGGPVTATPLITGGLVYIGSGDGTFYAFGESNGSTAWSYKTARPISASATDESGDVVVGSSDGNAYYFNPAGGSPIYVIPVHGAVVGISSAAGFTVSEGGNGAIVGSKPGFDNDYAWSTTASSPLTSAPTIVNGEVFVTAGDGTITCYTLANQPPV